MATVQLKTVKFGGSSLADAAQFQKVKAIIEADPGRRFVVPSAPGKRHAKDTKITDLLYRCQKLAAEGLDFSESLEIIRERYLEIAKSLSIRFDPTEELEKIGAHLKEGATKDYAASRGEYLNGLLLSDYLGFPFVDAAEVVCFNAAGIFQMEETMQKMRKRLSEMECAVIPGFYGAAPDGDIITFSRGGSDITGSLVARAVRAAMYENWTDVSGVLVADPRIVPNAAVINTVTYEELRELSYMGATVLHEDAIFPVRAAGIPINIRNTNDPSAPGTLIVADDSAESDTLTIEDILDESFTSYDIPKKVDEQYALVLALSRCTEEEFPTIKNFVEGHLKPELSAVFVKIWVGENAERAIFVEGLKKQEQITL